MGSNIDFLMKQLLGIIFIFISLQSVGQSKKKQILFLNQKVDSLQALLNVERSKSEENLTNARVLAFNLQEKINSLESQVSETKKLLKESETALSSKNQINKEQQDIINKLKEELQVKEDSLELLLKDEPIQLLHGNFFYVSDNELIKLFNVKDEDLGEYFISRDNPEWKPKYSIIGKQYFTISGEYFLLAVMGVQNPNDYHVNVGTSIIGCFKIENSKLILYANTFDTRESAHGESGQPPIFERFFISGKRQISVSLISFYNGMGYHLEHRAIYNVSRNLIIYNTYIEEKATDDKGNKNDKANWNNIDERFDIEFKANCTEYHDLVESKYSHNKLKSKRTLRYNPSTHKYEPVK